MTALLVAIIVTAALWVLSSAWDTVTEGSPGPGPFLVLVFLVLEGATYAVWSVVAGAAT